MTDKEAIDNLKNYIECLMEDYGYYKDIVEFRDSVEHLEKSLQTQQAEIDSLKDFKEIAESKVTDLNPIGLARTNQLLSRQCHKLQEESEKKEKMINSIKEYAQKEIDVATEDIEDYIDDDREGNKDIIGELKEWREHWKDIIRIMNNEKTYIDFEYKVTDTNVGERKVENGN